MFISPPPNLQLRLLPAIVGDRPCCQDHPPKHNHAMIDRPSNPRDRTSARPFYARLCLIHPNNNRSISTFQILQTNKPKSHPGHRPRSGEWGCRPHPRPSGELGQSQTTALRPPSTPHPDSESYPSRLVTLRIIEATEIRCTALSDHHVIFRLKPNWDPAYKSSEAIDSKRVETSNALLSKPTFPSLKRKTT